MLYIPEYICVYIYAYVYGYMCVYMALQHPRLPGFEKTCSHSHLSENSLIHCAAGNPSSKRKTLSVAKPVFNGQPLSIFQEENVYP